MKQYAFNAAAYMCVLVSIGCAERPLKNYTDQGKHNTLTPEQQLLFSKLKKAQDSREARYDSGHFIWHQTDVTGKDVVLTKHEYWAKDNQFFRLDTYRIVDGKQSGLVRRLIDRPEGTTLIEAASPFDEGQIVKTSAVCVEGTCGPTPENISGQYFIAHANRLATLQVKDWIELWTKGEYEISSFKILSIDSRSCKLAFTRSVESGTKSYEVDLDPQDYRVRSWVYTFVGHKDGQQARDEGQNSYDELSSEMPNIERGRATSNFDDASEFECKLIEFDLRPAALEVFAIPKVF